MADPIAYQISKLNEFPRVASMALDLISAPAMSTSNERDFNQTGLIWTSNQSTLDAEVLGATMAMASWDREMLINMVDGKLQHGRVRKRHIDKVSAQSGESDSSEDDGNSDSEQLRIQHHAKHHEFFFVYVRINIDNVDNIDQSTQSIWSVADLAVNSTNIERAVD